MKKQNKILIFILIAAFITVVMSGCVPKDNGSFAIKIDDEIRIYDSVADFPEIYLFNTKNGERVGNGFDDFWYSATNIYLQSGKIYVKNGAPAEFSDSLKITYKEDGSIYKLVTVKKMFVPLTEIELKSRDDKTACLAGESLKLFVEYFPENASEKNAVIRIEEGNAALTTDGTLTVGNDADGGEEIKLLAETPEGLTSRLTIFVKEKIVITTAEDFANIRRQPSEDYVLGNDIDFKNIGTGVTIPSFDGTFDGAGYTIFNLGIVISSTAFSQEQYFGLFNVCDGKIYNLKVENFSVTGQSSQSGTWIYAGGVVGLLTSNGIIENVRVTGTVNISRSASAAGGIVGYSRGMIISCASSVKIYGNGRLGGIAGAGYGTYIVNCGVYDSEITLFLVKENREAGGLIGYAATRTLATGCTVSNTVVRYAGAEDIALQDIAPYIGKAVGLLNESNIYDVSAENSTLDPGDLNENYVITGKVFNQKINFGTGPNGIYGALQSNSFVIMNAA